MTAGGKPSDKLIDLHRSAAEGGAGMTTVAYCAVEADGRIMDEMMYMHEAIRPQLGRLSAEIHAAGGAVLMKSAGFDAVEIHFGHGYGLSQFISPKTNKRSDEYGGGVNNRMRLPLRVLEAIR